VPVIYDMQSSLPEQLLAHSLFRPKLVQAFLRRAERWLLRNSSLIVSSTGLAERVRRTVPEAGVREWRFASLEPSQSDSAREGLRRSMGIRADAPVVLYSGSFASYQGLAELLRAAPLVRERVPGATFVLVGAEGREGERLSTLAATMGLNDAIQIVPRQPRHLMPTYLAIADVLVSPRQHGGNLPLKIFDYLASGRPIVATDIPTHRAVLTEETAILVQPNAEAIAAGLADVLERPELAASLARNATEYAQANCGWLGFVDSVEELARAVTNRT
jgi:glycosyltransferase involved in cell wall biosynthesis